MATQIQAAVTGALEETAGFENEGASMPGAPVKLKVTKETVEKIKSLEGKTFEVDGSGQVTEV